MVQLNSSPSEVARMAGNGVDGKDHGARDPRWQRRPTERRREIIQAAADIFASHGFDSATVAEVAKKAGVSAGTVLHYFGSKAGLFEDVMHERFLEQVESLEEALASHRGSSRELLRLILTRAWKNLMQPDTVALIVCAMSKQQSYPEASSAMYRSTSDRWRRLMTGVLTAGIASGEFRQLDVDIQARIISAGLKGLALGACHYGRFDPTAPDPEQQLAQYLDMVEYALAADIATLTGRPDGSSV
jgi:AcrR family transcriptional regulator